MTTPVPAQVSCSSQSSVESSIATDPAAVTDRLTAIGTGRCVCVEVEGDSDAQIRLKRMGICPGRIITIVQAGDPMVLEVVGVQLGVSRLLASFVLVKQSNDTTSGTD